MNIEELIAGLKEKGLTDEEIKAELDKIKTDIDAYLGDNEGEQKDNEVKDEINEDEKMKEVFGY